VSFDLRYDRQQRIPGWDQQRLIAATVLVAGAGALGNEVLKNLALLGVGQLLIVDLDLVEHSNLSRTLLFCEADVGHPKAAVAANALRRINPALRVTALSGDLRFVLGLGRLRDCTLALGCLDNQGARAVLSRMCQLAEVPLLDGGMWALGGEVRAFLNTEGPCFDCTLSPDERSKLWLRYSCSSGFQLNETDVVPSATTITTTAVIGGLLAQEAVRVLHGLPVENGTALVYNGQAGRMYRTTLRRDPHCPNHHPLDWGEVHALPGTPADLTAAALLAEAERALGGSLTLELGRDLLLRFDCPACGRSERVGRPQGLVVAEAAGCPHCQTQREPRVTATVSGEESWADWTLAQLGLQPGDLLTVRSPQQVRLYVAPYD